MMNKGETMQAAMERLERDLAAALLQVKAEHSDGLQYHHAWMCELELRKDREKKLEAANLQNGELKRVLSYFVDGNSGHDIRDDGKGCKYHAVIGVDHVWPCPVAEAQKLVAEKRKCEVTLHNSVVENCVHKCGYDLPCPFHPVVEQGQPRI